MNSYKTITKASEGLYKEKGSKFIAFAFPAATEEEFKDKLAQSKKDYHDARHHCYAFRIGPDMTFYRYSDDGEPNNTAGKPIYGQIQSFELTNIGIIVIRYFGGTKLGVGGLITAYKEAAKDALENANIIEKEITETCIIEFQYANMSNIMGLVKQMDFNVLNQDFQIECVLTIEVPIKNKHQLIEKLELIENISFNFN